MTPLKKLKPLEPNADTNALIAQIESKDRRFRLAQTIFMVATFFALILIISAQQRTLAGVQNQLDQQKTIAKQSDDRAQDQLQTILRRFDCLTVFFSQKDRTNLTIKSIDQCTLDRGGDIQQFFKTENNGSTTVTPDQQPTDPKVQAPSQ